MRSDAVLNRFGVLIACASVGAHANATGDGFRQRDVKFLMDLFANWLEAALPDGELSVQSTQVQRYLDQLVAEGFARKTSRKKRPLYRLTRVGLIELISRVVQNPYYQRPEHFFFSYYFLNNYRERILELIRAGGTRFPYAVELELKSLLDTKNLIEFQIEQAQKEMKKINARISDSQKSGRLATDLFRAGSSVKEVVSEIERLYPYELNSQKPLSELFSGMNPAVVRWELEIGALKRVEQMWIPIRSMLNSYIVLLRAIT